MRLVLAICLNLFLVPAALFAQSHPSCGEQYFNIPIGDKIATAGFFANLWGAEGSVSYELEKIFQSAQVKVHRLKKPENVCSADCSLRDIPYMYFQSVPLKVLENYNDHDYCQELLRSTSEKPIQYKRSDLETIDQLMEWVEDFAQGSGKEGSDLYKKCDRSCSPRYFYRITKLKREDSNYQVSVNVICGHARDKSDDNYHLEYSFRWLCE